MLNKIRDKLALHMLRALYGSDTDFSCNFFGPNPNYHSEIANSESVGVVFQGPLINEKKLRAGLAHYRAMLPESPIVLSTWKGSIGAELHALLKVLNVASVESDPPANGGIMNVNRQIVSTGLGIAKIREIANPELVVKARTDYFPWRVDNAIVHVKAHEKLLGGRARIWGVDFNTRYDLPFSFADIFQVGRSDVMSQYWNVDSLYPNDVSVQDFFRLTDNQNDIEAILRLQPAEIFLARRYLDAQNYKYHYQSLEDYWSALAEWFGVLDSQHIELAFGKYSLAVSGYEPAEARKKRYVKNQDWMAMIAQAS
jgi:hypothetical protein